MRVSCQWLRELCPALEAPAGELAERLSAAGLAVDAVLERGAALADVRLASVKAVRPHPKRSGLSLVTVDHGRGTQEVVCGAANVPAPGGMVVLAPIGARLPVLPGPLAAREIGGVKSEGMLVSEAELGITDSAEGILTLPAGAAQPGITLAELVPSAVDWLLELDVTPNRADALGHVGVARELAALYGIPFELPAARTGEEPNTELAALVAVDNRDPERCSLYAAGAVTGVTVAPSPLWLRFRLEALGVRAISNVVDVTNLLLLEWGQPLHAFDLDRVRGGRIVVRRASQGERFTTLDGIERTLVADDLVIADGEGAVALAGVMGGGNSEITNTTTRVLIECAHFAPRGVRRTARRLGLHTESSHRFERGVDYRKTPYVLERAKRLIAEFGGGTALPGRILARGQEPEPPLVTLRSARLDALLGVPVPFDEALGVLDRLGFAVERRSGEGPAARAELRGASFRPDVALEVDLIDEVARVRGFDQVPTRLPAILPSAPRQLASLEREATELAANLGLSEALTYAFVSPRELDALGVGGAPVRIKNPLGEEKSVMRTSLLPGLLAAVAAARRHGETAVRLFTVGTTFHEPVRAVSGGPRPRLPDDVGRLPIERPGFAAVLTGPRAEHLQPSPPEVDLYDAKAIAVELVERLTGRPASARRFAAERPSYLHPRGAAELLVSGEPVGRFGPLHPDAVDAFELGAPVLTVEIDLDRLVQLGKQTPRFRPLPRVPAVVRDLSLVLPIEHLAGEVAAALGGTAGELCESIQVVGDFRGGSVPEGRRSLTFRVVYRDPASREGGGEARTLTDQEVDAVEKRMVERAERDFGAELRG